jgi:hypothetical protein
MANGVTFPPELGGNGMTVTDDDHPETGLADGGATIRLIPMFAQMIAVCNWVINSISTSLSGIASSIDAAAASANAAAASAAAAANSAAILTATSTTILAIGTGSKTFTTQSGKQFQAGQFVTMVFPDMPNEANMYGQVTSYSGTSLVVNVFAAKGDGVVADWNISVSGIQGATGAKGDNTTATNVTNTPAGGISATTVQAALNELDTEKFSRSKTLFLMGK